MPKWECSKCHVTAISKCVDDRSIFLDKCNKCVGSWTEDSLLRGTIGLKWGPKQKNYNTAMIEIDLFQSDREGREVEALIEMLELLIKHKHHISEDLCEHNFCLVDEKECDFHHKHHPVKDGKLDENCGLKKLKIEKTSIEPSIELNGE